MLHKYFSLGFLLILFVCVPAFATGGDEAPSWLVQAAAIKAPAYEKNVKAVVLQNDQNTTVNSDGKTVTTHTYAVRVLSREGRREAVAVEPYLMSASKVREVKGWLIRPDGTTKTYGKDQIIDQISDTDDVYNEVRLKIIDGSSEAEVGAVFGYQFTVEEMPLFYQDVWLFQTDLPVLQSRYSLNLPAGWQATSVTFNRANLEPVVNGTSYVWELRNLSPIADEPSSPSVPNIVPRIAVSYAPATATANFRVFKDWAEVSRWNTELSSSAVIVDDAIAAKARDLTVNAKTELEKIKAIGSFVQNLQYISIDIGIGKGNGYRPRSSTLVLQRGYGDCKDKANLMRALLKSLKIEAYPVIIYSGDPNYVRAEWASPRQFNHCIIAVKVGDETKSPTVITDPTLGRLLIFDATDSYTPIGDLPDYLQNSLALIIAGNDGKLVRMPLTPPEDNRLDRQTTLTLDASGAIKGTIRERSIGQAAVYERRANRALAPAEYNQRIEGWLVRGVSTASVGKVSPVDKQSAGSFDLDVEFNAPQYGQLMQGKLLVFKPAVVSRLNSLWLTDAKRTHPVILESNAFTETATFTLPDGFTVDEMPDAVKLETPFGKYASSYEVKDGKLIYIRSLTLNSSTVAVDKYASVQNFFSQVRTAEQSPVVLIKK